MVKTLPEELEELKKSYPEVYVLEEGSQPYILIPGMTMPDGCNPQESDVLLLPESDGSYPSRLYFPTKIQSPIDRNWNGQAHIGERDWHAFSWRIESSPNLTLMELLMMHLKALTHNP